MPTKAQMHQLGGREEHLGAGRGIIPPSSNPFPDFTGERIGIIVVDEQSGGLKIIPDPPEKEKVDEKSPE